MSHLIPSPSFPTNTNPTAFEKFFWNIHGVFCPCRRRTSKSKPGMSLTPKLSKKTNLSQVKIVKSHAQKLCPFILKILAKTLCIIWTHWCGECIFLLYRYYLPEACMNFAHHLCSSRCKQTQAIQSALRPGGERVLTGLGVLSCGQYPALNAQTPWRGLASSR